MEKLEACNALIAGLNAAEFAEYKKFDEAAGAYQTVQEPIQEGIKEIAIQYVESLANTEGNTYTIYRGQDSSADYAWFLRFTGLDVELVSVIDDGMQHHGYYNTPGAILYGVKTLEHDRAVLDGKTQSM